LGGKEPGKWLITLTVMGGTLMGAIDITIVNVAIPHIQGNVGASVEEITWVSTGYILSSVIIMPIAAFLSSRFGRKRLYLFSIVLFTAGSAVCGLSSSLSLLVAARIVQGVGGGGLYPLAQAILRETFPPEEQGMAMGVYGLGVVMGPALGPPLGGWLTDHYSWPWIFFVNIPIGVVAVSMVVRFIQDPPYLERERGRVDYPGLAFMIVGLGALQLLLEQGQRKDWFESEFIVYLAVVASLGLLLFVWREWTCDRPAVDLRILKNPSFTSGCLIVGILTVGQYGTLFLFPLFLQDLLGYNAFDSGLALMPRFLAMAVTMPVAGRLYNRIGNPRLRVFLLGALPSFSGCRILGHLHSPAVHGDGVRPDVRGVEYRGPLDDRQTADDGGDRSVQRPPPGSREHRHRLHSDPIYRMDQGVCRPVVGKRHPVPRRGQPASAENRRTPCEPRGEPSRFGASGPEAHKGRSGSAGQHAFHEPPPVPDRLLFFPVASPNPAAEARRQARMK
jgi:multidrug resistance protein